MNSRSRSTLFLIEQLIVIAVFALCAAACVRILADSYFTVNNSRDLSNALLAAESGAESFKATGGDVSKVAELMAGETDRIGGKPAAVVYYNDQWRVCGERSASYRLSLTCDDPAQIPALLEGNLTVAKITGEKLISFTVMARSQ